jgi:hypothetical protein
MDNGRASRKVVNRAYSVIVEKFSPNGDRLGIYESVLIDLVAKFGRDTE